MNLPLPTLPVPSQPGTTRALALAALLREPRMFEKPGSPGNTLPGLYDLIQLCLRPTDVVLEVGSYAGVSSELFAWHCRELYCVDNWQTYGERELSLMREAEQRFDRRMAPYVHVFKQRLESAGAAARHPDGSLDLVYIDGSHAYQAVRRDIQLWWPKLKVGGYLAGHDFDLTAHVARAVQERFGPVATFQDSSWVVRKQGA